jgi:hypothetical protein
MKTQLLHPIHRNKGGLATFSVTVGVNRVPRDLTVIRSVGKNFDKPPADALTAWGFRRL